jgi:glucosylceramidase
MGKMKRFCRAAPLFKGLLILTMGFFIVGSSYGAGEPVTWMRTSNNGDRLKMDNSLSFHTGGTVPAITITVTPATKYQTMMGFGGSFTESSAIAMNLLSAANRAIAIKAYFGPTGANYAICRAQMGASDFSAGLYSFDDVANDFTLANFSVAHDVPTIIRYIKDALVQNPSLKIFGSPWSAPAWMKTNNNMDNGGNLKADAQTQNAWALYFVKYVQQYAAQGVPIWGITIQNEPAAVQSWPSMIFSAAQERDFLKNYLGPVLAANGLGPAVLPVMFLDHNRDMMVSWAQTFYSDPVASAMVWGEAIHWYDYMGATAYANVLNVYNTYPGKHILATEQCITGGPHPGDYNCCEEYARDIYGDCLNGCEGWVDWNLALNEQGGPNVSSNWCSAGILVNRSTLAMTFNPIYYYMAQFSKYCRPGARRIGCTATGTGAPQVIAFQNPDNSIVVIAYTQATAAYSARIVWGTQQIEYTATARSLDDFVWTPAGTSVTQNVPAPSLKQQPSASQHIVGLNEKQNMTSAAKYTLTGKKVSTEVKNASDASAQSIVAPGVYVEKPSNKDADKK